MGQNSSRQSISSSFRGRDKAKNIRKRGHSDLSATFNIMEKNLHFEQLNINQATEEQLMTLPGITRVIAKNIIEYRQTIGAFRKVEDLAVVSGVGASKLEMIRPEICVNMRRRANTSQTSSLNDSTESIPSSVASNNRGSLRVPSYKVVNINKANIYQLMAIRGIDQELAAHILHYREKKGLFKSIDGLLKVKGFSPGNFGVLRHHFTIDNNANAIESIPQTPQRTPQNFHFSRSWHNKHGNTFPKCNSTQFDTSDLFELLSSKSSRPINEQSFHFKRNGKQALRIASWNLQQFTIEKVDNPGVREVVCRTILENGFSMIACQELGDKQVLDKICAELTNPCLRRVQDWPENRGTWEYVVSEAVGHSHESIEYNGFLYDTSKNIDLLDSGLLVPLLNRENGNFPKRPFWASFRLESVDFTAVCVHISGLNKGRRNSISESLRIEDMLNHLEKMPLSKNVIILGDMNLAPTAPDFNPFREKLFTHIVPLGNYTNANSRNFTQNKYYDNIWISKMIGKFFTNHWGIVKQGLNHLAIPNGWTWDGLVSDHCPVWAEFYVQNLSHDESPTSCVSNGIIKEESQSN